MLSPALSLNSAVMLMKQLCVIPLLNKHYNKILKQYKQNTSAILNYYQKDLEMKIFITFNPHIENLSQKRLLNDFRYALQKYYRKELGRRYFKHIDNQYDIAIFEENGKKFYEKMDKATHLIKYIEKDIEHKKEPHLHIIADVPLYKAIDFFNSLKDTMKSIYSSLTTDYQLIANEVDERNAWNYCKKENGNIITKIDLCQKKCYQHYC